MEEGPLIKVYKMKIYTIVIYVTVIKTKISGNV